LSDVVNVFEHFAGRAGDNEDLFGSGTVSDLYAGWLVLVPVVLTTEHVAWTELNRPGV